MLLQRFESLATSFGRTTFAVGSEVAAGRQDPAVSFAASHGYAPALVELRSDLDVLPSSLDELLTPLEAELRTLVPANWRRCCLRFQNARLEICT